MTIDGLENIGVGKWKIPVEKSSESGIIGITKNAVGQSVIIVKKTKIKANPNSITQVVNKKGGIDRNYYDNDGNQIKQISNNAPMGIKLKVIWGNTVNTLTTIFVMKMVNSNMGRLVS